MAANGYWVGFDLGGTKMLCAIFDNDLNLIVKKRKKSGSGDGTASSLDRIAQLIEKTLSEIGATPQELLGIGIGCPGPVEWDTGVVRIAVNLNWKDVAVGPYLTRRLGCPTTVLNDVDAGVFGEYSLGAAQGSRCTVGLFPGTGIGGGCVYEGSILRGRHLTCMEIGHTRISSSQRTSGAKLSGTVEVEASRLSIAAECAKLAIRGDAPNLLAAVGTDIAKIRSRAIAEAIEDGDKEVERVVRLAAQQIGICIVNLIHILLPDTIVLGGGLVEAMPKLYFSEIEKATEKFVFDCFRNEVKIVLAKLGDDAGAIGAAAWAKKQFEGTAPPRQLDSSEPSIPQGADGPTDKD